jgi:hypothetical protein
VAVDGDVWTELGIVAVCIRQVDANSSSATSGGRESLEPPDAASIVVTRLSARSEATVIRPYLRADQDAYERWIKGDIFNAIKADQNLENVESRDFGVFEDLSSLTMRKLRAV